MQIVTLVQRVFSADASLFSFACSIAVHNQYRNDCENHPHNFSLTSVLFCWHNKLSQTT